MALAAAGFRGVSVGGDSAANDELWTLLVPPPLRYTPADAKIHLRKARAAARASGCCAQSVHRLGAGRALWRAPTRADVSPSRAQCFATLFGGLPDEAAVLRVVNMTRAGRPLNKWQARKHYIFTTLSCRRAPRHRRR